VPWTKPADLEHDDKKPLPKLGGLFPDGFHAAAFSAEVYFIPRDFKEKDLRRMINPRDGEVIESVLKPLPVKDEAPAEDTNPNDKGNVSGKVTYRGQPLSGGTITFAGSKAYSASIAADGSYQVRDVPVGKYKLAIATAPLLPRDMPPFPRFPKEVPGLPKDAPPNGVPPEMRLPPRGIVIPTKYADPHTSGLTYTVVKGSNTHDFRLD
jgi:hypothetical protein